MRYITVKGRRCTVTPLGGREVEPGLVVGWMRDGRVSRVFRVLCLDGDEVILRNVRHDDIIEAFDRRKVSSEFGVVEPAEALRREAAG